MTVNQRGFMRRGSKPPFFSDVDQRTLDDNSPVSLELFNVDY